MNKYTEIIRSTLPDLEKVSLETSFQEAGIDSIDLLNIRVEFEGIIGRDFSDTEWLEFNSLADIIDYCQTVYGDKKELKAVDSVWQVNKIININMPQMAIGALSESWLFKEIGDTHWALLCTGLNTPSLQLKDENDNRLYATFVRIRMESSIPLNKYEENDTIQMKGNMNRFGSGMYFSNMSLNTIDGSIEANLMTSFSIRNDIDNTKLMKSQPATKTNAVPEFEENPLFGNEYRLIKKGVQKELILNGYKFSIQDEVVFKSVYEINPYYDLNGVGLLYFAAYPIINNTCEARFFNKLQDTPIRWEQEYHVIARDILYFANCNINERINYFLNGYKFIEDNKVVLSSSLYRESDNVLMARIFTVKKKL